MFVLQVFLFLKEVFRLTLVFPGFKVQFSNANLTFYLFVQDYGPSLRIYIIFIAAKLGQLEEPSNKQ